METNPLKGTFHTSPVSHVLEILSLNFRLAIKYGKSMALRSCYKLILSPGSMFCCVFRFEVLDQALQAGTNHSSYMVTSHPDTAL